MADIEKKYVDYAGLGKYDELIKGHVTAEVATEAARAAGVESGLQSAINTLNGDATTAGSVAKAVKDLDDTLAAVAKSGSSADVTYDNTTSGLTATDVKAAIDEVAAASSGGVNSKTVYLRDESAGQSDYAKVYKLYQGANAPDAQTDPAALVGTINIAKDKVVQDGHIVTVEDGVDSDGDTVPAGTADGTYVKLTLQNVTTPIYINVQDLIDVYTGGTTAEATVAISATNEITVTINKIAATKVIYQAADEQQGTPEITVKGKIDAIENEISQMATDVTQEIADAIGALDTSSDVAIATHTSSTGSVQFAGSIAEADGIIGAGSADTVTFTPVTNAEIQALFSTVSA